FVDDTVTDYSRPSPTVASISAEDQNNDTSTSEETTSTNPSKPFIKFVKPKDSQPESKLEEQETPKKPEQNRQSNKRPKGNQRNWNSLKSYQLGPEFVLHKKPCFNCGDFSHLAKDCRRRVQRETNRSQDHSYKSSTHRSAGHRPHGPSMNPRRPTMNGKQAHPSHKAKNIVSTTRCLELLHIDLFSPSVVRSYGGNRYTLVIVDNYSRYTWTRFLEDKTEAFDQFKIFSKKIQNKLGCTIVSIRTDHDREFDNDVKFGEFGNANGITHNFSASRTPQSNGVVERKNMTLQEMSRTMLNEQSLPQKFWCNAVDTSTYILNRILIRAVLGKTPYKLLRGRKPTLDYFRVFESKCFILNTKDYLIKFDPKSYEGIFLGYSQNSKAYIILNKHTRKVKESLNVTFDGTPPLSKTSPLVDDDLDEEEAIKVTEKKNLENNIVDETLEIDKIVNIKESRNHPLENIIENLI
nr:retrovirus-related Pol polyprotein from transposon TNT 1-94 [Tanacetum cinerariifolium]